MIYCHNHQEKSYYFTSCSKSVISGAQRKANRWTINELKRVACQYFGRQMLAPNFLSVVGSATVVNERGEEQVSEASGRKMNNIGRINIVILKQTIVEKAESDF